MKNVASDLPATSPPLIDPFRLLTIGASAGGISALKFILAQLPADFPVPIVIVQHIGADAASILPQVLGMRSRLHCKWAEHGEVPRPGTVMIAAPGANTVLDRRGRLSILAGEKPRLGWPSIDTFFNSAAEHFGAHVIAVVLSGMLWDGSQGILSVRRAGGATMALDYRRTEFPDMPTAAIDLGKADLMLSLEGICEAIGILAERGVE